MPWKGRRQSSNIEDRRGWKPKAMVGGGIGTILIALAIYFLVGDPSPVLNLSPPDSQESASSYQETAHEKELAEFVSVVLADTDDVWGGNSSGERVRRISTRSWCFTPGA